MDNIINRNFNYIGQERKARQLLMDDMIATAQEVALMSAEEVGQALLDKYDVLAVGCDDIILIDKEHIEDVSKYLKHLDRQENKEDENSN